MCVCRQVCVYRCRLSSPLSVFGTHGFGVRDPGTCLIDGNDFESKELVYSTSTLFYYILQTVYIDLESRMNRLPPCSKRQQQQQQWCLQELDKEQVDLHCTDLHKQFITPYPHHLQMPILSDSPRNCILFEIFQSTGSICCSQ